MHSLATHEVLTDPGLVIVEGELDLASVPDFERACKAARRRGGAVRLDLSQVTFLDCAGLRALLGSGAVVVRVSPAVRRLAARVLPRQDALCTAPVCGLSTR
jgi:anti-anti-sigma factor